MSVQLLLPVRESAGEMGLSSKLTNAVLDHYYHYAAELLLGMWRTYASLDQDITADGITKLPAPQRMWYLHQSPQEW
jgi:hypothetical protein